LAFPYLDSALQLGDKRGAASNDEGKEFDSLIAKQGTDEL